MTLIPEQGRLLSEAMNEPIEAHATDVRQGPKGTMLKYVKHGYVTEMLNKVFGPFWSFRAVDVMPGQKYSIVQYEVERQNQRTHVNEVVPVKEIVVMGELRIRIYANDGSLLSEEVRSGSGGKVWEKNITFADALQSAESESLKRAAFRLGRKFGLELYYDDEARRAEYEEKNTLKPVAPPTTIGQLFARLQEANVSDEEWLAAAGYNIGDTDPADGKSLPKERDVPAIWQTLMERRGGNGNAN